MKRAETRFITEPAVGAASLGPYEPVPPAATVRVRRRLVWCGRASAGELRDITTRMLAQRPRRVTSTRGDGRIPT